jgi:hypothetical protein
MPLITGWVLTDTTGKQWTFEEFAYAGGLESQKEYLSVMLSQNTLSLQEAEQIITEGSWEMLVFEQPE